MTTTTPVPHEADHSATARRDLVTGLLGLPLIGGIFTDGWAHFNRPGLETFFTPWHAVLYSGLLVMTLWLLWVAWRVSAGHLRRAPWMLPPGYAAAFLGAALFALGGLSDLVWHELFGIEVAIDALLSPTHLLLGLGGLLILSTPLRSSGVLSSSGAQRWRGADLLSLTLLVAVAVFFLLYTSAFTDPGPLTSFEPSAESAAEHQDTEQPVVAALMSYLLTTVVFTLPVLLLERGGKRPAGGATLVVAAVAVLPVLVINLPAAPAAGALGAVAGAALFDLLTSGSARLAPRAPGRGLPPRWSVGLLALLVWSGHLLALALADALRWPVSLWTGTVVLAALLATAAATVLGASAAPSERSDTHRDAPGDRPQAARA